MAYLHPAAGQARAALGSGSVLPAGSVTSEMLADDAVTTDKIADDAVTMDKIADSGATAGQVIKYNGSDWAPAADETGA